MTQKISAAAALQHGLRRRLKPQALLPIKKRGGKLAAQLMAVKRAKHEERTLKKQKRPASQSGEAASPEAETPADAALQHIFGRCFDDNDRSAADILATLCMSGILQKPVDACASPQMGRLFFPFLSSRLSCSLSPPKLTIRLGTSPPQHAADQHHAADVAV